jgi:hypothetical protein
VCSWRDKRETSIRLARGVGAGGWKKGRFVVPTNTGEVAGGGEVLSLWSRKAMENVQKRRNWAK